MKPTTTPEKEKLRPKEGRSRFLLTQCLCLVIGRNDSVYEGRAEASVLQSLHAHYGGAAGGAHGVLDFAGMAAGFEKELRRAQKGLSGSLHGQLPGQAAGHAAVSQRLDEHLRKGGAAALAPNTMTKLNKEKDVSLCVLFKICMVLNAEIGEIVEFVQEQPCAVESIVTNESVDNE